LGAFIAPFLHEEIIMAITAAMVKELRERTGLGMMDCKKALVEADGDAELAIENLRKSSGMKAAKKAPEHPTLSNRILHWSLSQQSR